MLLILASHLDLSLGLDACCLAATCATMWGQLHLGEILSSWEKSFKELHIACRSDLSAPFSSNGSCKLHLPFPKVKKNKGEDIIICCQCNLSDPIHALEHHLTINIFAEHLPLFCYISPAGIHCLMHWKLLTHCNSIWVAAGIPIASGHSFALEVQLNYYSLGCLQMSSKLWAAGHLMLFFITGETLTSWLCGILNTFLLPCTMAPPSHIRAACLIPHPSGSAWPLAQG
jgi:hypothetical protein